MRARFPARLAAVALLASGSGAAQVTFHDGEGFRGAAFTAAKEVRDFRRSGFDDRAASAVVDGGRWEVCVDARFAGRCAVLRPGAYDSLRAMGLHRKISSVRPADNRRPADDVTPPMRTANYEYRRRPREPVYDAPVISVRAVTGHGAARCWVERQRALPGPPAGRPAGVLGHQIAGGHGRDAATGHSAVANTAAGSAGSHPSTVRGVGRCRDAAAGAVPAYWDVIYSFRGVEHQVQLGDVPGRTVVVNAKGEPRQ